MIGEGILSKLLRLGTAGLFSAALSVAQPARTDAPRDFGTAHLTYVQIPGTAFFPLDNTTFYGTSGSMRTDRSGSPGDSAPFSAPLNLPSGAFVKYLELDACDNSGGTEPVSLKLINTNEFGTVVYTSSTLQTDGTGCKIFSEDLSLDDVQFQNQTKHYFLESSISFTISNTVGLIGAIVGYQLEVSPPPATPTFADVPTSFLYFRAIEALAASGITSGCGSGNFCPNQNVTRGEMAKFLANALGLYWQ